MLNGIRDINFRTINTGFDQGLVEEFSGGPDKWLSLHVFLVARLLTYQNNASSGLAFAENGLSPGSPQWTGFATHRSLAHFSQT